MTELYEINVRLSDNQKKNLSNAYHKRETIVLRLTNDSLNGNDTLYVPAMVKKKITKKSQIEQRNGHQISKNEYQETSWRKSFEYRIVTWYESITSNW